MRDPHNRTSSRTTIAASIDTPDGPLRYLAESGFLDLVAPATAQSETAETISARLFAATYLAGDGGAEADQRPVVFCFNGGPGSSSMWLHLGLLGPRIVDAGDADEPAVPPYRLHDNPDTLLRDADLVLIDPVGTGFSHVGDGVPADEFDGDVRDADIMAEAIRRWVTEHERWASPKYLLGESYGTIRAVAVADRLANLYGMALNGLMLLSPVLSGTAMPGDLGRDTAFALRVPTCAAVAHFHGRHGDRELDDLLEDAERFALDEYLSALARGTRLSGEARRSTAARLADLCGLSVDYVEQAELRVGPGRFAAELLRERGLIASRLDGRFTGSDSDRRGELYSQDPALHVLLGAFASAFSHYVSRELEFHTDRAFQPFTLVQRPWRSRPDELGGPGVIADLGRIMRSQPHLRVYVGMGLYDGSTPYLASEYELAHVPIPERLQKNIVRHRYRAGHMMYVHEPSRIDQSRHLREFVTAGAKT